MKVLIQLLSSNESENVQPFHLSSTAVAYVVGDFASMPKQKKKDCIIRAYNGIPQLGEP